MRILKTALWTSAALIGLAIITTAPATADQQFLDDVIIDGSACIGFDCVNGESFGFDTLRLKENNLRIKFQDTSTSASFPSRDWQITANETSNGGANKFSIDDIDGGRTPFTIEAGAPSHSLYVEDGGRVGFGTSTPVVDLHVKSGNTPTLRLEQDGTSGFGAQIWDLAGNEANLFIRDASNGSTLPFRIFPGAPSNAITIEATTGDVGMGTTSPSAPLHIFGAATGTPFMGIGENPGSGTGCAMNLGFIGDGSDPDPTGFFTMRNCASASGTPQFRFRIGTTEMMTIKEAQHTFLVGGTEIMTVDAAGVNVSGAQVHAADFVFEEDYELMPLAELGGFIAENKHLPEIASADEMRKNGLNMNQFQGQLLQKIEELTLYTLNQQATIDALTERLESLEAPDAQ